MEKNESVIMKEAKENRRELSFKKSLFISPLLGGSISSIIFIIYASFLLKDYYTNTEFNVFVYLNNLIIIIPAIFIVILSLSYILFIPSFFFGKFIQKKYELKEKQWWFVMFIIGLFLGVVMGGIIYQNEGNIIKLLLIIFSFSFGFLFNSSFFSTLSKKV